tara:strand:- start:101015 stop:101119 length:105 start_codon:yes stop_codon:yes gene_type:complete
MITELQFKRRVFKKDRNKKAPDIKNGAFVVVTIY